MWGMCEWDGENGIKARMVNEMIRQIKESPVDNWFYQNYYWNNSAENVTTETFAEYSTQLQNATEQIPPNFELKDIEELRESFYNNKHCKNANIIKDLRNSIIKILVTWGHTFNPAQAEDDNDYEGYLETGRNGRGVGIKELIDPWIPIIAKYIKYRRENGNADIANRQNISQILDIAKKENDYRIASWSKLLAALEPGKFFIYDSRVAIALTNFCYIVNCNRFWNIPPKKNTTDDQNPGKSQICYDNFIKKVDYNNQQHKDFPTCYFLYLNLLKKLAEEISDAYNRLDERIINAYTVVLRTAYPINNYPEITDKEIREMSTMAHIEKMLFMMADDIQGKKIKPKTGNLLNFSNKEGIAVFIPSGLTELNDNARKFYEKKCGQRPAGAFNFTQAIDRRFRTDKFLCLVDNNEQKINSIDDMRSQIEEVLNAFKDRRIRTVAMNGIRCNNLPDPNIRPEQYQRQFVEEYLAKHPGVFEKIILVDARGGFDK